MMFKKDHDDSVGIHSTLSAANVASNCVALNPSTSSLPTGGIRGRTISHKSAIERGIQKSCGVSKTFQSSESNVNGEEGKSTDEQKKEKASSSQAPQMTNKKGEKCEFSEPKLLTSLKIIESLHSLGEETCHAKPRKVDSNNLKKAARKLNVPFEEKIYKDLIDLHVNEEALGLSTLPVKPKEILRAKDPEPVLSDFYKPKFNKEYVVKPPPPLFEMSKFSLPQVPSVYEISKRWEPENTF